MKFKKGNKDTSSEKSREQAFTTIYQNLYPAAYQFAKAFVGPDEAADITSTVFISLWRLERDFSNIINVKAYVYRSIRNACISYLQNKKYSPIIEGDFESVLSNQSPNWLDDDELSQIREYYFQLIVEAAQSLPKNRLNVLKLAFDHGLKNEEIAQRLNMTERQVRNLKARALDSLRIILKKKGLILLIYILDSLH